MGSIPGLGRSSGGGHGHPLKYSCLENSTDRGAWRATVHGSQRVGHGRSDSACMHADQGSPSQVFSLIIQTDLLFNIKQNKQQQKSFLYAASSLNKTWTCCAYFCPPPLLVWHPIIQKMHSMNTYQILTRKENIEIRKILLYSYQFKGS